MVRSAIGARFRRITFHLSPSPSPLTAHYCPARFLSSGSFTIVEPATDGQFVNLECHRGRDPEPDAALDQEPQALAQRNPPAAGISWRTV